MKDLEILYWINKNDIQNIPYSSYWTDEKEEEQKPFYILDGNFSKIEKHIEDYGLLKDFEKCLMIVKKKLGKCLEGIGMDLAAGSLWTVPFILKNEKVEKLYCLEYSSHRLLKIGPKLLDYYNVPKNKVVLVLGDFYNLRLPNSSLDFLILVQAFHHADHPEKLLDEMKRVLKPNGIIIITGEPAIYIWKGYVKHAAKYILSKITTKKLQGKLLSNIYKTRSLIAKRKELYPPEPVLGDHYYTYKEYQSFFRKFHFEMWHFKDLGSRHRSFILKKR